MKIAALSRTPHKIYSSKAHDQAKHWNRLFKKVDDKTLLSVVQTFLNATDHVKHKQWIFAGIALNELSIRPWANKNDNQLELLRDRLRDKSRLCFSSRSYSIETAGIKFDDGIVHPYAYSDTALKVRDQWERVRPNKSLTEYVHEDLKPEESEYIKTHAIRYVRPEELDNYLVTFEKGKVLIGNDAPKDEWYMFVLDAKKKHMYAAIKVKGIIHHTSLTQGVPVACAGEFKVKDGKIERITLRSGHYRPTELHAKAARRFLEKEENLGPKLMSLLEIEPYTP